MPCITQTCRQGRDKCATPWSCGTYSKEANYDTSPHRVHYVGDEPVTTPDSTYTVLEYAMVAAVVALVAVFLWQAYFMLRGIV